MLIKSDWSKDPVEEEGNFWEWSVLFWWVLSCIWFEFGLLDLFCFGKEFSRNQTILGLFYSDFVFISAIYVTETLKAFKCFATVCHLGRKPKRSFRCQFRNVFKLHFLYWLNEETNSIFELEKSNSAKSDTSMAYQYLALKWGYQKVLPDNLDFQKFHNIPMLSFCFKRFKRAL